MPDREASTDGARPRRGFLDWFLRDPRTGRIVVAQWPNPALGIWAVATLVGRLELFPARSTELRWLAAGALSAWAADEVLRGASPARRLLGLVVLSAQVYRLLG